MRAPELDEKIARDRKRGKEVLADSDLEVISDIGIADSPIFYIGQRSDRSAGILGFQLQCAPMFGSVTHALIWAAHNSAAIDREVES